MTAETFLAPRNLHNADLCNAFIQTQKITCRYPKVTTQLPVLPLERQNLVAYGYNPSIVRKNEGLLMAYRFHPEDASVTRLALAEVTFGGRVQSDRSIDLSSSSDSLSHEDPKLFNWQGQTWLVWVESTWPDTPLRSVVKFGMLEGNKVVKAFEIIPPNPKPMEKNLVPIPYDSRLFFIYESEPEQTVLEIAAGAVVNKFCSPAPFWPYGSIRGGSSPIRYQGKLLRFFHSGVDKEWGANWPRRYFIGACLMEPKPPFAVVAVSSKPVVYGSEICDLKVSERPKHYKPNVVFPGGAVEYKSEFLLAAGLNDSQCAILRIKPAQLNL